MEEGGAESAADENSSAAFFTDAELIFLRWRSEKSPRPTGGAGRYDGRRRGRGEFSGRILVRSIFTDAEMIFLR